MKFTIVSAVLATLALVSAAPSVLKRQAECPVCDNCGYNFQQFTPALGGVAPPVYSTSQGFETCGTIYYDGKLQDALDGSCMTQVDNCEESTPDQSACKTQYNNCLQQALESSG